MLAEGWGFEPQIDVTAYTRFPSVLLQPLGHPSLTTILTYLMTIQANYAL